MAEFVFLANKNDEIITLDHGKPVNYGRHQNAYNSIMKRVATGKWNQSDFKIISFEIHKKFHLNEKNQIGSNQLSKIKRRIHYGKI